MSLFPDNSRVPISPEGAVITTPKAKEHLPVIAREILFNAGASPAIIDVNGLLGKNGTEFSVTNDGPGDFSVALSNDGVAFSDERLLEQGEVWALDNISVDSIRITHIVSNDSAYRVDAI